MKKPEKMEDDYGLITYNADEMDKYIEELTQPLDEILKIVKGYKKGNRRETFVLLNKILDALLEYKKRKGE